MDIGPGKAGTGGAGTIGVDRAGVAGMAGVADVDVASMGEALAGAARARRQHAIEHVDPQCHGADHIGRQPRSHQIARRSGGQVGQGGAQRLQHHLLALADGEAADGVAVETDGRQRLGRFLAQIGIHTALDNAEQPVPRPRREGVLGARGPGHGEPHGDRRLVLGCREGGAFVQHHGDVGIQLTLDLDRALRGQVVHGAVDVRAEGDARFRDLAQFRQRHYLEAAGIGQDRTGPIHEAMQAAQSLDHLRSRAQHQVIGVGEDHLRARRADVFGPERLDRRRRAHGHEGGRFHRPMGATEPPAPCGAGSGLELEPERRRRHGVSFSRTPGAG